MLGRINQLVRAREELAASFFDRLVLFILFLYTFSHKIVDALPNMRKGFRTELSK